MRLVKMLGLAAVAAMAAMAFVGATSASAKESTQLCKSHAALTCGNAASGVRMVDNPDTTNHLLTELLDVLCDHIEGLGTPLTLAKPQQVHISGLLFGECEASTGDGCLVVVLEQPLANLLKTGLDQGTLTATNGSVLVECEDVLFGTDFHCVYDLTGLEVSVGAQHLDADNTQINEDADEPLSLCPEESFVDMLLVTVDHDIPPADPGDTRERYVLK